MPAFLVTGASTGIGRATATLLAERGHTVLAGVRRAADAPEAANIEPLVLDVTSADDLAALAERLRGGRLDGLVNNAGIVVSGPVEGIPLEEWRRQLDVNVVALVAVTQAALPALRAARGRIVNVGSIGAVLSPPFAGPYTASKGAVRALSNTLRRELLPLGVRVVLVEPGAIDTPIWSKGLDEYDDQLDGLSAEVRAVYGARLKRMKATTEKVARGAIAPPEAAAVIVKALTTSRPRAHYFIGREAKVNSFAQRVIPTALFDRIVVREAGGR